MLLLLLISLLVAQPVQRSIEIWSEHPIAIEIEWLTIDEAGGQTVTSRRKTAVGPPVPLEFTHGNDRYVRFSYTGASPRTYSTAELVAAKKLRVPDVLPGGELLLLVPRMVVRPIELLIEGPRVLTVPLETAVHTSLGGMPAGEYRIVPIYEGQIKGAPRTVKVRAAQSTLEFMPAEDVGAVRITAADDICATATEMQLNALVRPDVGPKFKAALNRNRLATLPQPRCEMTFGGLKPGAFEAFFFRGKTTAAVALFDVAAQAVSGVDVTGSRVKVEGRVTMNGKPMKDAVVMINPTNHPGERWPMPAEVATDADGYYSIALEAPGTYSVTFRSPRTAVTSRSMRQAAFVEGRNVVDFAMTGGTITLEFTGGDEKTRVQVRVEGPNSSMASMFAGRQKTPPAMEGLPFGAYKVWIVTGATMSFDKTPPANAQTVFLSASSPDVTLKFDLTKR